jgi:hypothetical protein
MLTTISSQLAEFSRSRNPASPRHLGQRYDRAGTFQHEPGNTVVCHLIEGSETARALANARSRYLKMPEASQLAFTPLSSLHMTLFQGIIEHRREQPYWPADLPEDTSIDAMTENFIARLQGFASPKPFSVRTVMALPTGLIVEPATAADRVAMADWRNRLADVLGYRHPDHETYVFHITFAYVIERFADAALPIWQEMLNDVVRDISARAPVLELRAPAFCSFNDMNHFEELVVL